MRGGFHGVVFFHTSYLIPHTSHSQSGTRNSELGTRSPELGSGDDDFLALGGLRDGVPLIKPGARHWESGLEQGTVPFGHRFLILGFFFAGLNPRTLAG